MTEKYQGPVPEGTSVKKFRETGRTVMKGKGKEVLYKDYMKKKKEIKNSVPNINLNQKIKAKNIIHSEKSTLILKERKPENAWEKQNMFFKEFIE